jgi:hypothetical protein
MVTTTNLARELNITKGAVGLRARKLGIEKIKNVYRFTDYEADAIREYKRPINFRDKYHKRKISIVEFFLQNPNNKSTDIADKMDLTLHKVDQAIDEWCNNEHFIIVESKINEN